MVFTVLKYVLIGVLLVTAVLYFILPFIKYRDGNTEGDKVTNKNIDERYSKIFIPIGLVLFVLITACFVLERIFEN